MIMTIDFRLFPESKSKNFQNVLFDSCCIGNIGVFGGGAGRTKKGSWQDRNGSLAGQIWELGRTEMGSWQRRIEMGILAKDHL